MVVHRLSARLLQRFTIRGGLTFEDSGAGDDLNQGDVEDEVAIGRDFVADGAVAIGEACGNEEGPLVARFHQFESLAPAGDDLGDTEGGGYAAFDRTIKDGAVSEGATVVDGDLVEAGGGAPIGGAGGEDAVLQTAGGGVETVAVWGRGGACAGADGNRWGGGFDRWLSGRWRRFFDGAGLATGENQQQTGGNGEGERLHGESNV